MVIPGAPDVTSRFDTTRDGRSPTRRGSRSFELHAAPLQRSCCRRSAAERKFRPGGPFHEATPGPGDSPAFAAAPGYDEHWGLLALQAQYMFDTFGEVSCDRALGHAVLCILGSSRLIPNITTGCSLRVRILPPPTTIRSGTGAIRRRDAEAAAAQGRLRRQRDLDGEGVVDRDLAQALKASDAPPCPLSACWSSTAPRFLLNDKARAAYRRSLG